MTGAARDPNARRRGGVDLPRRAASRLPGVALGLLLALPAMTRAEDDVVAAPQTAETQQGQMRIKFDDQIGAMLNRGTAGGNDLEAAKQRVAAGVDLQIDLLERICRLDEKQKRTLTIAARLDAARVTATIGRVVRRYSGRVVDLNGIEGQREWQQFHEEFAGIQTALSRFDPSNGLFSRILDRTLDQRQREAWAEEGRRRKIRQWRMLVDRQLASLESTLGLSGRQCDAIEALLLERPIAIDFDSPQGRIGLEGAGLCALWRLDPARVDAILDERQREKFRPVVQEGRIWERMLRQRGAIDE